MAKERALATSTEHARSEPVLSSLSSPPSLAPAIRFAVGDRTVGNAKCQRHVVRQLCSVCPTSSELRVRGRRAERTAGLRVSRFARTGIERRANQFVGMVDAGPRP